MLEIGQTVRLVRDIMETGEHPLNLPKDSIGEILEMRGDMILVDFPFLSTEWVDIDDVEALGDE